MRWREHKQTDYIGNEMSDFDFKMLGHSESICEHLNFNQYGEVYWTKKYPFKY